MIEEGSFHVKDDLVLTPQEHYFRRSSIPEGLVTRYQDFFIPLKILTGADPKVVDEIRSYEKFFSVNYPISPYPIITLTLPPLDQTSDQTVIDPCVVKIEWKYELPLPKFLSHLNKDFRDFYQDKFININGKNYPVLRDK